IAPNHGTRPESIDGAEGVEPPPTQNDLMSGLGFGEGISVPDGLASTEGEQIPLLEPTQQLRYDIVGQLRVDTDLSDARRLTERGVELDHGSPDAILVRRQGEPPPVDQAEARPGAIPQRLLRRRARRGGPIRPLDPGAKLDCGLLCSGHVCRPPVRARLEPGVTKGSS